MEREWTSTGEKQLIETPAEFDRIPPFDPRTGDHLWIIITTYKANPGQWDDPTHTPMLDRENLICVSGPGCFYCEQPYSTLLASRRCKGKPQPGTYTQ
jgi:hypothetical protein